MYQAPLTSVVSQGARDHRIDFLRGIALVMIFINHVPGNLFEHLTSRNFGFSDAAEGFVLLAGVSAALAYGKDFTGIPGWKAVSRIWSRAWSLYLVHIALSVAALGLVVAVMRFGGNPTLMMQDNFQILLSDPIGMMIGLPLMLHQFGYVNILPLYIVLLLAAPGALWVAQRWPLWLLAGSVALWALSGVTRFNVMTYPGLNYWFLNPFCWQLIFVVGLLTGLRLKRGERLVPVNRRLTIAATSYLAVSMLWVMVPAVTALGNSVMVGLANLGLPPLFTNFDKGHAELPRLLHVLSLAYVLSILPGLREIAASRKVWMLTVMGRQSLTVFALGTILSFVARAIRLLAQDAGYEVDLAFDFVVIGLGVGAQLLVAAIKDHGRAVPAIKVEAPKAAGGYTLPTPEGVAVNLKRAHRIPASGKRSGLASA